MNHSSDNENNPRSLSPAAQFLQAARNAIHKKVGDGVTSSLMHNAMQMALEGRMKFWMNDAEDLNCTQVYSNAGRFHPLNRQFYATAISYGNLSYAKLSEANSGIAPWTAARTYGPRGSYGREQFLGQGRVAETMAVLLPAKASEAKEGTRLYHDRATEKHFAVWWVTSMTDQEIIICRYSRTDDCTHPFERTGSPTKRWKMGRDEWRELQAPMLAENAAAKARTVLARTQAKEEEHKRYGFSA